ncbi:hypothetical protein Tco_1085737 [Tanacetum coccineum]
MVAFLKKLEGSEGFHQIVDFLNSTQIKYALIENPTIYVSLIHQFWQTASASTSKNGEMEITATVDGGVKIVTEASIRRHLKLEDSDGISTLPNTKIFEQLALMGSTVPIESHHTPTSAPSMPHDSPLPRVHSHGSDEGSMTLHELTILCTTLSKKVESLESNLKQTKLTYGATYTKLIMKRILPNRQGRFAQLDKDEGIMLVQMGAQTQGRHEHDLEPDFEFTAPEEVYTAESDISTANVPVSIAGAEVSTCHTPKIGRQRNSNIGVRLQGTNTSHRKLYLMRRSLKILRKFHWTILG